MSWEWVMEESPVATNGEVFRERLQVTWKRGNGTNEYIKIDHTPTMRSLIRMSCLSRDFAGQSQHLLAERGHEPYAILLSDVFVRHSVRMRGSPSER